MTTARRTLAVFVVLWSCGVAQATSVTHTFGHGHLAASATFDVSGSSLVVTLTNTSTSDCLVPSDLLTAVLFDLAGDPVLTRASAVLGGGSHVYLGADLYEHDPGPGGSVGAHWAYVGDISAGSAPVLAEYGIYTKKNIICVGRMQRRKRLEHLVAAFSHMNRPDTGLILVGPDPDGILNEIKGDNIYKLGPIYGEKVMQSQC